MASLEQNILQRGKTKKYFEPHRHPKLLALPVHFVQVHFVAGLTINFNTKYVRFNQCEAEMIKVFEH